MNRFLTPKIRLKIMDIVCWAIHIFDMILDLLSLFFAWAGKEFAFLGLRFLAIKSAQLSISIWGFQLEKITEHIEDIDNFLYSFFAIPKSLRTESEKPFD
jgi:hypothetical protein